MADYQLTTPDPNGPVLRTEDQAYIPADPANRDWQQYQQWKVGGNKPDPLPPPIDASLDSVGTGKTTNQILGVAA